MSEEKFFAVAGNPVLHSRSPQMFQAAFRALGLDDCHYLRFAPWQAREIAAAMRDIPIRGLNVTSPFKEEIIPFLDDIDEAARRIGAVNTIIVENDRLKGFNTDAEGIKRAFLENGITLAGKRAVVLGSGGAAKAAVVGLKAADADVLIVNRTFEKAKSIAETFVCRSAPMESLGEEIGKANILVSCLPRGIDIVPGGSLDKGLIILDANYGERSVLLKDGTLHGCTIIDGREWLLYQGISAFTYFTGMQVSSIGIMRKALYEKDIPGRKNIALIGFMGTGKSTVGRYIAEKLKLSLIDIDNEIEKRKNVTIEEIFANEGEEVFRKIEAEEIERACSLPGRVISCGGGAVINKHSVDQLRQHCVVAWLMADIDTILDRIGESGARPLLKVRGRRSTIETLLALRKPCYAGASDILIDTDHRDPQEIAERICYESGKFLTN
jgi:shikimate dehydrogenase